jgi:signal transduction histidine kinase
MTFIVLVMRPNMGHTRSCSSNYLSGSMSESTQRQARDPVNSVPIPAPVPFESLIEQLVDRAGAVIASQHRLHQLMIANMEIAGELSLQRTLQHTVESACELVGARYGALAVAHSDGTFEQFIHDRTDPETVTEIADPSNGRDLAGALSDGADPIRLCGLSDDSQPGSSADHAPMNSFLGLPIRSGDHVFGNLYLTDRDGGEFTAEDEEMVSAFAATAGTAIEKARLYEQTQARQRWLLASAEISAMLLAPDSGSDPLQVIIEKICQLADADLGALVLPAAEPHAFEVVVATGRGADQLRGMQASATNSLVQRAMDTGRGSRVETVEDQHRFEVHLSRVAEVGPVMVVPLSGQSGAQGAIVVGRLAGRNGFAAADLELAEAFAIHAAIARELAGARADQQRLILLKDRSRIARDLHDHVIQRLFAAGLTIQSMTDIVAVPEFTDRLDNVITNIDDTIRQIRTSIFQLQNSDSTPSDVRSIVLEIIDQITPVLGFDPATRFDGPLDTVVAAAPLDAIGAVVREAVTNVARHAHATAVDVELRFDGQQLSVDVSDDGIGLGPNNNPRRSGLDNLKRRADIWGGTLTLTANQPHGTRLLWTIPVT